MKARFLHFADCHLGYWQYNHKERFNDFARAFTDIIDTARREQVDFVLLAGDLFHKRSIEALTLNQAMSGLERLKNAGIPCIAVEGNHELAYQNERIGWVEMLAARQLLTLLNPEFDNGAVRLTPYANRKGAYFDPLPGLRIYGLRYYGASTATAVASYAQALANQPAAGIEYTIFMTHAGVEGVIPDGTGGLSLREWSVLRPYVDYLALGHVHKPFDFEHWIYNPGSGETCTITETAWLERGYYLVEVDTARPRAADEPKHAIRLGVNARRTFHRLTVKTDLLNSPSELIEHCRELLQRKARDFQVRKLTADKRPVVELQLLGVLPFDRAALDVTALEQLVTEAFDPLLPLVRNYTRPMNFAVETDDNLSRPDLERQVLKDLLRNDARYREHSEQWADLALELKRLALEDVDAATILTEFTSQLQKID